MITRTQARPTKPAVKVSTQSQSRMLSRLGKSQAVKTDLIVAFWEFAHAVSSSAEISRLNTIKIGFEPAFVLFARSALRLSAADTESIFNLSMSTLERRLRQKQNLDPVASERLDRIAVIASLADEVFEDQTKAADWLSMPNMALGNEPPIRLCETEIGATQVRRVLHAIEWGNVV
ncbi:antitoxin Xre/MbcA/ParS toxin-binding domain-containing protein [Pseudomonas sp.]|uniref:type II RES/Xre toxin-antitoxin system antitoxin n=1 Tax=Pseudomonas sp. TaxID=306 RepID=UPI002732F934|nr:antitoxin Xre/MbcA/ParS toxin-binding domain-containing protein [Pseudomonas sp.]MDP3814665.1 DUF2384 domain-containing protein [Pseudomonas sp.]